MAQNINLTCEKCGYKLPKDISKSNENWDVYNPTCPKCGGKAIVNMAAGRNRKTTRKNKRPKMETLEELKAYLEENKDKELPFNQKVWDEAVEATKDKVLQFKTKTETDFDGNTKTLKIPNGTTNPVSKYFMIIALPHNNKPVKTVEYEDNENTEENEDVEFEDEDKQDFVDSLCNMFFSRYNAADKKIIKDRLGDYYDNYEINDGADKFTVIKAVADELEIAKLTQLRLKRGEDNEARLKKIQDGYLELLESMKALKKQRSKMDEEGKNKLTLWVDTLEREGFKPTEDDNDQDSIDQMLDAFEKSMIRVFKEG